MDQDLLKGLGLAHDTPSYFDVFVFLADQQMVEVELLVEGPSAGLMDSERGEQNISKGSYLSVALAAASALRDRGLARLKPPSYITDFTKSAAKTQEACCLLDLYAVSPVFFEFATRISYMQEDESMFAAVQSILRHRLKKLSAILENDYSLMIARQKTTPTVSTTRTFEEASKTGRLIDCGPRPQRRVKCLEGMTDASRKTFIRGLTLGERRIVEIRREQLLKL